jgi:hypothetical protein
LLSDSESLAGLDNKRDDFMNPLFDATLADVLTHRVVPPVCTAGDLHRDCPWDASDWLAQTVSHEPHRVDALSYGILTLLDGEFWTILIAARMGVCGTFRVTLKSYNNDSTDP